MTYTPLPDRRYLLATQSSYSRGPVSRDDFYERLIPVADRLYDEHLAEITAEPGREERNDGE